MTIDSELDLHRHTLDEALPKLDQYLYNSFLAGMTSVCINHGRGTGTLRSAVQKELKRHPLVKSYRSGRFGEGGTGVTIVQISDH
jgi:DNA mismatch repair protein MutS2